MTYVVNDSCIKCKYTTCVEVCPVNCFYEGENMVVINPDECIDCGVCEPECPIGAIKSEDNDPDNELAFWINKARELSGKWPRITVTKGAMKDADEYAKETNKYEKYFSEKPGSGNN